MTTIPPPRYSLPEVAQILDTPYPTLYLLLRTRADAPQPTAMAGGPTARRGRFTVEDVERLRAWLKAREAAYAAARGQTPPKPQGEPHELDHP